ncbi:MAG: hypothetical protein ACR2NZ_10930 [Rubripirellula sp.]
MAPKSPNLLPAIIFLGFAVVAMSSTGCSRLNLPEMPFGTPVPKEYRGEPGFDTRNRVSEQLYHAVRQARTENGIVLEVVGDSTPARVMPLPTGEKAVYVSNLLTQTGILDKLHAVDATLYRHSNEAISGIPMDVRMSKDKKTVRPESDYALQPGDRLKVRKAPNPAVQSLYNFVLGK